MSDVAALTQVSAGDQLIATVVSANLDAIVLALNSGALDSANYGAQSILSQHIKVGNINSTHMAANAVRQAAMMYNRASGGVQVLRIGSGSVVGGYGRALGEYSHTAQVSAVGTDTITGSWANALHGNPNFLTTPTCTGIVVQNDASDDEQPHCTLYGMNSSTYGLAVHVAAGGAADTATVWLSVIGHASS